MKKIKQKYTNFILTVIAVAMIGINFQLFGGDIISEAEADIPLPKINKILRIVKDNNNILTALYNR